MTPTQEVEYILYDCFLAVGQAVGPSKRLDVDAIKWWNARYRAAFSYAIAETGTSWARDRHRVIAVGRYLGQRAAHYAGDRDAVDRDSAERASRDVESGCRMNATRDGLRLNDDASARTGATAVVF